MTNYSDIIAKEGSEDFGELCGFPVLILRHPHLLHWCGYVGVPEGHPLYGVSGDGVNIEVHGGVTYYGQELPKHRTVIPATTFWWFGFDCAHAWDLVPAVALRHKPMPDEVYRTREYAWRECERMAIQFQERAALPPPTKLWSED